MISRAVGSHRMQHAFAGVQPRARRHGRGAVAAERGAPGRQEGLFVLVDVGLVDLVGHEHDLVGDGKLDQVLDGLAG